MVTQTDRVRSFLQNIGSGNLFSTSDVFEDTGIPKPTIRRILAGLVRSTEITRREPGIFRINILDKSQEVEQKIDVWHRKFIGTQKYKGNPRQFFAVTYEKNDFDREEWTW